MGSGTPLENPKIIGFLRDTGNVGSPGVISLENLKATSQFLV